jgi:hypothetical protein
LVNPLIGLEVGMIKGTLPRTRSAHYEHKLLAFLGITNFYEWLFDFLFWLGCFFEKLI